MTVQQPEALHAFAHEILSLQAPHPLVQAQEPVAFALRWPSDTRLNLSTVFDTEKEAAEYAEYCSGGVLVVPLYTHPAAPQEDDFWPVDGNASRKQLIEQIGQMNFRLTALSQENDGLIKRVKGQAEALQNYQRAQQAAPVAQGGCRGCCA